MMNVKTLILIPLSALMLSACTHYAWVKPMGDPATYPADHYTCSQSAVQSLPPVYEVYDPYPAYYGWHEPRPCFYESHHLRCPPHLRPMDLPPPPRTIDLNRSGREDLYNSCMNAHGWFLQPIDNRAANP
jgi:hypothetical protein